MFSPIAESTGMRAQQWKMSIPLIREPIWKAKFRSPRNSRNGPYLQQRFVFHRNCWCKWRVNTLISPSGSWCLRGEISTFRPDKFWRFSLVKLELLTTTGAGGGGTFVVDSNGSPLIISGGGEDTQARPMATRKYGKFGR